MRKFYKKGKDIIEIEDFADRRYIVWGYKENEEQLKSNVSMSEKEAKDFIRKKRKEGYKLYETRV